MARLEGRSGQRARRRRELRAHSRSCQHFQFLDISTNYKEQGGDVNRVLFSVILIATCLISDLEAIICIKQKEIAIVNLADQVIIIIELRSRDHEGSQL